MFRSADDTIDDGFIRMWVMQESFTAKNKSAKVVMHTDHARTERHVCRGMYACEESPGQLMSNPLM